MSKKNDLIFQERLAAAEEELKALYMELYHDEEAYDYFLTMLKDNFDHRKPALKKLDEQRRKEPDWYKRRDLLGMLMYVQAFGRTGPEWNGTLKRASTTCTSCPSSRARKAGATAAMRSRTSATWTRSSAP